MSVFADKQVTLQAPRGDPWTDALSILRTTLKPTELEEYKYLFHSPPSTSDPSSTDRYLDLSNAISAAIKKRDECEQQQYSYTRRVRSGGGEVIKEKVYLRDQVGAILEGLKNFANMVGPVMTAATQPFPPAGVVWSCFSVVLNMVTSDIEIYSKLLVALDEVVAIMTRARVYEKLYTSNDPPPYSPDGQSSVSEGRGRLLSGLPGLYAAILLFAVRIKQYFGTSASRRFLKGFGKPFFVEFQPMLDSILTKEAELKKEASLVLAEDSTLSLKDHKTTHASLAVITQQVSELKQLIDNEMREEQARESERAAERERLQSEMSRNVRVWLKPVETDYERERNQNSYQEGTCMWVLQQPEFLSSMGTAGGISGEGGGQREVVQNTALRFVGIPGSGKSVLSAFLISHFRKYTAPCESKNPHKPIVLHFFFNQGSAGATQTIHLFRNLIHQLLSHSPPPGPNQPPGEDIFLKLVNAERTCTGAAHASEVSKLWHLLQIMLEVLFKTASYTVYIVIDALDECSDREQYDLASQLHDLTTWKLKGTGSLKLFLTSRPEPDLEKSLHAIPKITLTASQVSEDIRQYVSVKIHDYPKLLRHSAQIIESIVTMSDGMFRYATLILADLSTPSKRPLSDRLATLPKGINELYEHILAKLPPESMELRQTVFRWLVLADREIKLSELGLIYATEGADEFNIDEVVLVDTKEEVMQACGSLVEVDEQQRIRVSHLSVKEFLLLGPGGVKSKEEAVVGCLVDQKRAQLTICTTIFTMLTSETFRENYFLELDDVNQGAYETGGYYMNLMKGNQPAAASQTEDRNIKTEVKEEDSNQPLKSNVNVCNVSDKKTQTWGIRRFGDLVVKQAWRWFFNSTKNEGEGRASDSDESDEIISDPENPIPEIIIQQDSSGEDSEGDSDQDQTGTDSVQSTEDQEEANNETRGTAPVSNKPAPAPAPAFVSDYSASIIDPDVMQQRRQAEFSIAFPLLYPITNWMTHLTALESHMDSLLQDAKTDPQLAQQLVHVEHLVDDFMQTDTEHFKLWQRIFSKATVRFAARNFNLNISANCYSTALHMAASYNLPRLASRLLAKGADPCRVDSYGSTPLHWAACFEAPKVIVLLLDAGCPIDVQNLMWGYSALHYVSMRTHKPSLEIMHILIDRGATVDARDNNGNTPIHLSAYHGTPVAELQALLDRVLPGDVSDTSEETPSQQLVTSPVGLHKLSPKLLNNDGETPLHLACNGGNLASAKFLLERRFTPNTADIYQETPLHESIISGRLDVCDFLLANGANPNARNVIGGTPLHYAALLDRPHMIPSLLAHGADINTRDHTCMTPLLYAARKCHLNIIEILSKTPGCMTKICDEYSRNALHLASAKGHLPTVVYLLNECGLKDQVNDTDNKNLTPLIRGARNGHAKAVAVLLEAGAEVNVRDEGGRTALFSATWCGRKCVEGQEPPLELSGGPVAKMKEARQRYVECVKLLLAAGADPTLGVMGVSAVGWVRGVGLAAGVKQLGGVNMN